MRREGRARGAGKDSGGAGKKRSGPDWQALAERAAFEAKFVLIAERKKQEEA